MIEELLIEVCFFSQNDLFVFTRVVNNSKKEIKLHKKKKITEHLNDSYTILCYINAGSYSTPDWAFIILLLLLPVFSHVVCVVLVSAMVW